MKARLVVAALGSLLALPALGAPETYVSDPDHTLTSFEVRHIGFSLQRGRFNRTSARIVVDRAARTGSIEAVVEIASLDTAHQARDDHLRSEDYFNAAKFPTMTFKSSRLRFDGERLAGVDGEFTLMGVTRPVSLEIAFFRCGNHPVNKRELCGADARTAIKRSEFGMTRGTQIAMNDEVRISIQIEAYKQ